GRERSELLLPFPGKDQRHASLRSRPLIRPSGTFSREREKGFLPIFRRKSRDQPFSCAAGEGLHPSAPYHTARKEPFSCEAGEGGAKRRMRARAKRATAAPSQAKIKSTRRCARAPSSALRAPSPVNGRRASFPSFAAR